MAVIFSKAFGPSAAAADTLTTIGSAYQFPVYNMTIEKITVAYGNVVNAKETAGLVYIDIPATVGNPFVFAFGGGSGGATNSNNGPAEIIKCKIPVPSNTTVTVKVIAAEALADVTVSLGCGQGSGGVGPQILCAGGAGQDTAADTLLALTKNAKVVGQIGLTPYKNDVIKRIRITGSGVVDAKAASGILYVEVNGYPFPLEFAFGRGSGGAATSSSSYAQEITDLNIPIIANSAVGISVLTAEITLSVTVTLHPD